MGSGGLGSGLIREPTASTVRLIIGCSVSIEYRPSGYGRRWCCRLCALLSLCFGHNTGLRASHVVR
jgi:hypothetical protein